MLTENLRKHLIIQCNNEGKTHKCKITYLIFNFFHYYMDDK